MAKTEDYVAALSELEQMHAEGRIEDARYEVHRARLMDEARRPLRPADVVRNLIVTAVIVVAFVLLLMAIANS